MKNLLMSAGLLSALLLFQPPRVSAAAGYPFLCRGQLIVTSSFVTALYSPQYDTETDTYKVTIQFRVNPTNAGEAGQNLQAGACAWVDRPTNSGEGTKLQFTFEYDLYPLNLHMLTLCSVTRNCVLKVIASNPGDGSPLQGYPNDGGSPAQGAPTNFGDVQILFPANLGYTIIPDPSTP
jgi:hypothetical protein